MDRVLSAELIKAVFDYDPSLGVIRFKDAIPRSLFSSDQYFRAWHTKYAGKAAGNVDSRGYVSICFLLMRCYAHRIAFAHHYGYLPEQVDHINGNRSDNRICNLRAACSYQNLQNRGLSASNKSGVKGVYWHSGRKEWRVKIGAYGKTYYFSGFSDRSEAESVARRERQRLHNAFSNHGDQHDHARQPRAGI